VRAILLISFLERRSYMKKGIDISEHNGNINMEKVKKSGIEFIILRLGYGKNQNQIDKNFKTNYEKAINSNIPVGVYLYSYATNINDSKEEAKLVLDNIKGLKIEYPIFIDMEDADNYKAKRNVSNATCIDICETFCQEIESAGYYVGIYANLDWLNNKINDNRLDKFDKWVAQWNNRCTYKKEYGMWQYSSKGKVEGITGNVDLNYSIYDYKNIIKKANLNHLNNNTNSIYHVVVKGDTLTLLAKKYNVNWEKIYELNKDIIGDDPNQIYPGQNLFIKEE
jgi:lysozyme